MEPAVQPAGECIDVVGPGFFAESVPVGQRQRCAAERV